MELTIEERKKIIVAINTHLVKYYDLMNKKDKEDWLNLKNKIKEN